jgi:hypothetical protein
VRLHEVEAQLVAQASTKYNPLGAVSNEDLYEDKITWALRGSDLFGYATWDGESLIYYEGEIGRLTLRAGTHAHRVALNHALPEGLRIKSTKRDRWVVAGLDNVRQVPFHNAITLQNLEHRVAPPPTQGWVVRDPLPYPDKTHIPKAIQRMVKAWAANYQPNNNHGACGLCIAHNEGLMEFDIPNHLLEHILSGTLPFVMMDTIIKATVENVGRTMSIWDVTPFRQACYQIAVAYAYKTLRSTYA